MSTIVYFDQSNNTTYKSVDDVRIAYPTLPEEPTEADLLSVRVVRVEASESPSTVATHGEGSLHAPIMMSGVQ